MDKRRGITTTGVIIAVVIIAAAAAAVVVILRSDPTGKGGSGLGKEFVYDDEQYRRTDPALIRYKELRSIETGLQVTRGIAVGGDDRLYVAGDKTVIAFDSNGERFGQITLDDPPRCLAVTANGTIYVGMTDHIEVVGWAERSESHLSMGKKGGTRFARPSLPPAKWESLGEKASITSIAVSGGNVFVADSGNSVVVRYDASGKILDRIGRADKTKDIPGLLVRYAGVDVTVGPGEVLWVTNPGLWRVEAYSFDGDLKSHWGRQSSEKIEGFCGCCNPVALAILPGGGFVTAEKGLARVKVYDDRGLFKSVVAGPESFATGTVRLDLAVDSQGRVLVLDPIAKAVRIFVPKKDSQ